MPTPCSCAGSPTSTPWGIAGSRIRSARRRSWGRWVCSSFAAVPVTPIPVSPLGGGIFSVYTLSVLVCEAVMLWPWAAWMALARREAPRWQRRMVLVGLVASLVVWWVRLR